VTHAEPARHIVIGTRGSALALAQTAIVQTALEASWPGLVVGVVRITTRGDTVLDRPLAQIGGKGLFVTEIEDALRAGRVDLAVHSAKDLPSALPADMLIGAYLRRADARDVLVSDGGGDLESLAEGARVGTSSPRRAAQLRALRADLDLAEIRGNVDTRLRKLNAGEYDALVLAAAGLDRLGIRDRRIVPIPRAVMIPAVGQGAIAVEIRDGDSGLAAAVAPLQHAETALAVGGERAFLAAVGGGCNTAVAAHVAMTGEEVTVTGMIGSVDGRIVRDRRTTTRAMTERTAREMALALLDAGGRALLHDSTDPQATAPGG